MCSGPRPTPINIFSPSTKKAWALPSLEGNSGEKETVVQMAKANGVRWYGYVLKRDDEHVLRKALEIEVKGKRKRGQPKKTWKTQVEKESKSVGLEKEDAFNN